jgi:hypothetical protein
MLSYSLPVVTADTSVIVEASDEIVVEPIATSSLSVEQYVLEMCIAEDGTTFATGATPGWMFIRGSSPTSLTAWGDNGSVLWTKRYTSWELFLTGIATDNSYIYVTGKEVQNLYLGKYDFSGKCIWNITQYLGEDIFAFDLALTEDGTIVISVGTASEHLLVAYNLEGVFRWSKVFESLVYIGSESNSIYAAYQGHLQKYSSDGTLIWSSTTEQIGVVAESRGPLYTLSYNVGPFTSYSSYVVEKWNATSGERAWSTTVTLYNTTNQLCNSRDLTFAIIDENLFTLLNAYSVSGYYLQSVDSEGRFILHEKLLNNSWYSASLAIHGSEHIHIAGCCNDHLTLFIYEVRQLSFSHNNDSNLMDIPIVGTVAVGVFLFDAGLIIYLRRRYPKR